MSSFFLVRSYVNDMLMSRVHCFFCQTSRVSLMQAAHARMIRLSFSGSQTCGRGTSGLPGLPAVTADSSCKSPAGII